MAARFWQIYISTLLCCHFDQLVVMNDQFSPTSNQVAFTFQAPRMPIFLIPQLVLLLTLRLQKQQCVCFVHNVPWSAIWPSEALSHLSLYLLHLEPCSVKLTVLCPTNMDLENFRLKESIAKLGLPAVPKHRKIYHLQGGRWNKKATGKISSVKPGSLLLVTIQNM